jgi:hypothetical protein
VTLPLRTAAALLGFGLAGLAGAAGASLPAPRTGLRPLDTAVVDPAEFAGTDAAAALARARSAGATFVRLTLDWRQVASRRPRRPADPTDPAYVWVPFDADVRRALGDGLEPIVTVTGAPPWGRRADGLAAPADFAAFAAAAARRYQDVRYWQVWNEPNHVGRAALKARAAAWYRGLVNRFSAAVHAVDRRDDVIAGGCSPFTTTTAVGPLHFMRQLFAAPVSFDVWATNPYTSGGPIHHANGNDDVSLGDLSQMAALLRREIRAHEVRSTRRVRFWVTEFAWDTDPPDPEGVPVELQTRWTAEALYRAWAAGVSLVAWFKIRDEPLRTSYYQSGLYFRDWKPKRTIYAFRFPLVAFGENDRVFVWSRTPAGRPQSVTIQQRAGGAWRNLGRLAADRYGIFSQVYATSHRGPVRARLDGGDASVPFSLDAPPDRFYPVFGS